MASSLRPISEHAPLIEPSYQDIYGVDRKTRAKPFAYAIALIAIITTGLIIWASSVNPRSHATIVHNHQWAQMEAEHALIGYVPPQWQETEVCRDDHEFTLTLAIKQSNIDQLHDELMKVSHPKHGDTFRKYWYATCSRDLSIHIYSVSGHVFHDVFRHLTTSSVCHILN